MAFGKAVEFLVAGVSNSDAPAIRQSRGADFGSTRNRAADLPRVGTTSANDTACAQTDRLVGRPWKACSVKPKV